MQGLIQLTERCWGTAHERDSAWMQDAEQVRAFNDRHAHMQALNQMLGALVHTLWVWLGAIQRWKNVGVEKRGNEYLKGCLFAKKT